MLPTICLNLHQITFFIAAELVRKKDNISFRELQMNVKLQAMSV